MVRRFTDQQLIDVVTINPNLTQTQLAAVFECGVSTISYNARRLVKAGKLIQQADNNGVYHYTVPTQELKVQVQTVKEVVEVNTFDQWMEEVKSEIRGELDKKVRDYLNRQYMQIMGTLCSDLNIL